MMRMFRCEKDVIRWIFDEFVPTNTSRKNLSHLKEALEKLGSPHLNLKTIHIAGTNGKGSTVSFLGKILRSAGYSVGTFTSPHLEHFGERIALNGQPISAYDLVRCANILKPILYRSNSEHFAPFDVITLLSFIYFNESKVDIVIYETGIGGRLDSTNVITPLACGITNVGDDHAEILGNTKEARAFEKLGIAKRGVPLFTTEEDGELLSLFREVALHVGAPFIPPLEYDSPKNVKTSEDGSHFDFDGLEDIHLSMFGTHQITNAILAYSIAKFLNEGNDFTISPKNLKEGLKKARWPGRFEIMGADPTVILDGAHNVDALEHLKRTLANVYPNKRKKFIVALAEDKNICEFLDIVASFAHEVNFTTTSHPRLMCPRDLCRLYPNNNCSWNMTFTDAIKYQIETAKANEIIIVCGSLYLISDMRKYLKDAGQKRQKLKD